MSDTEAVLDSAIATMQGTGNQILAVCKEKLHFGKTLNVMEVKELREILEAIAEALDQDSLLCQEAADNAKKEVESDDGDTSSTMRRNRDLRIRNLQVVVGQQYIRCKIWGKMITCTTEENKDSSTSYLRRNKPSPYKGGSLK